jgi:hypothetical protein
MGLGIIHVGLSSKTGRRAAITLQKYYEHGLSPLFFVCATSTLTSASGVIILYGSKAFSLSRFDYLVDPFLAIGTALGLYSDFIDRNLKWYSPLI